MYQPVSKGTRLHDRDQRAPITIYPDDVFVNRGRFRMLIIIGLAVMTLLGAVACGRASGSDGSGGGEQGVQEEAQNVQDSAGDDVSEANRDDDQNDDRSGGDDARDDDDGPDDDGRSDDRGEDRDDGPGDDDQGGDDQDDGDDYGDD